MSKLTSVESLQRHGHKRHSSGCGARLQESLKGGTFLGSGTFGCVFSPALLEAAHPFSSGSAAVAAAGPAAGPAAVAAAGPAAGPAAVAAAGPAAVAAAGPAAVAAAGPAAGPAAGLAAGPAAGLAAGPAAGLAAHVAGKVFVGKEGAQVEVANAQAFARVDPHGHFGVYASPSIRALAAVQTESAEELSKCFAFKNAMPHHASVQVTMRRGDNARDRISNAPQTMRSLRHYLEAMQPLFDGVDAYSAAGLVHGDIKLDNTVIVQQEGGSEQFRFIDFGLSFQTAEAGGWKEVVERALKHVAGRAYYAHPLLTSYLAQRGACSQFLDSDVCGAKAGRASTAPAARPPASRASSRASASAAASSAHASSLEARDQGAGMGLPPILYSTGLRRAQWRCMHGVHSPAYLERQKNASAVWSVVRLRSHQTLRSQLARVVMRYARDSDAVGRTPEELAACTPLVCAVRAMDAYAMGGLLAEVWARFTGVGAYMEDHDDCDEPEAAGPGSTGPGHGRRRDAVIRMHPLDGFYSFMKLPHWMHHTVFTFVHTLMCFRLEPVAGGLGAGFKLMLDRLLGPEPHELDAYAREVRRLRAREAYRALRQTERAAHDALAHPVQPAPGAASLSSLEGLQAVLRRTADHRPPDIRRRVLNAVSRDAVERTLLTAAVAHNDELAIRYLFEEGADPNIPDAAGRTAVHYAVHGQRASGVLFDPRYVHVIDYDAPDEEGQTPLEVAAVLGYEDGVRALLARGASTGGKSDDVRRRLATMLREPSAAAAAANNAEEESNAEQTYFGQLHVEACMRLHVEKQGGSIGGGAAAWTADNVLLAKRVSGCNPAYLAEVQAGGITTAERRELISWLFSVHNTQKFSDASIRSVLFAAVSALDRYLSLVPTPLQRLQYTCTVALKLAWACHCAALEVGGYPLNCLSDTQYAELCATEPETCVPLFKHIEADMRTRLGLDAFNAPTAYTFLTVFAPAAQCTYSAYLAALRTCSRVLLDYGMLRFEPARVAAAALALSTDGAWPPGAADLSGYSLHDLETCMHAIHALR